MKNLNISNIAKACGGTYYGPSELLTKEVSSIYTDSRKIEQDSLFIPIVGERVDGHDFIENVFSKGALVTLSEKKLDSGFPYVLVESSLQALKDLAEFYLEQLAIPVVGITGSVGKTSTKEMIASVLAQKYCTLKTDGNFNNEIGLPLTVFRLREEHQVAVLEMGISDFGEMSRLTKIAKPDVAVITNIGLCHLENLGSRDGILKAKTEIFEGLKNNGTIVLNGDDDKLATIEQYEGIRPVFFGYDKNHEIYADEVENLGLKGVSCKIHTKQGELSAHIPVPGVHMVMNAMAACAVGLAMGLNLQQIRDGIQSLKPVSGRTNIISGDRYTVIDDCYNANPVSMKAALDVLAKGKKRKIAVLGDMGELGEDEKKLHYEVGAYAADCKIDALFCCGTLSKELAKGARERREWNEVFYFEEKAELMSALKDYVKEQDTVLIKASHFMNFPEIVRFLQASVQ